MTEQKNNIIQVYGMQRSGTNFLEYTLRYNFDIDYDGTTWGIGEVPGDERYAMKQSLKHLLPKRNRGKALIIRRDFDVWNESVKRQFPMCRYNKDIYNFYYDTPYRENWHTDDYLLVEHEWCVKNYEMLLNSIRGRFLVHYKEDWKQPMKRVHWDSGTTLLEEDYKL